MPQCIIHPADDGGLAIVYPVTSDLTITQLAQKDVPSGVPYAIVDSGDIPSDRVFRSAWRYVHGWLVIDLEAAKSVQRDRWRQARNPLLTALDVQWMRAMEQGDVETAATIAAEKQLLRDVTDTDLSSVTTPAELKAVWPEILNGH